MSVRDRDRDARETQREATRAIGPTVFRAVSVFDVSQTDPACPDKEPVALGPARQADPGRHHTRIC